MKVNIPRVQELLDEIVTELQIVRKQLSISNPDLAGVFDHSIMKIEVLRNKLLRESFSRQKFVPVIKIVADLIDIINKWHNTLSYKFSRLEAA
jgi:hypothetical protein